MSGDDQAREKLEKILSQHEYQVYHEDNRNILEVLWDKVKTWVMDVLSDLFSSLEPSNAFGNVVVGLLFLLVLALLGGIVVWFIFRPSRRKRMLQRTRPVEEGTAARSLTKDSHLQKASDLRQHNDLTEAARHVFLALLLHFNEIGWVKARSQKTNWDYVMELRQVNKAGADAFYELAGIFDDVFYGQHPMTLADYDHYRKKAEEWMNQTNNSENVRDY